MDFQGLRDFLQKFELRVVDEAEAVFDELTPKIVLHIEGEGDSLANLQRSIGTLFFGLFKTLLTTWTERASVHRLMLDIITWDVIVTG